MPEKHGWYGVPLSLKSRLELFFIWYKWLFVTLTWHWNPASRQIEIPDEISGQIQDNVDENLQNRTQGCQTDEECGYPWKTCYKAEVIDGITSSGCFVTWWMILIIVIVALVVLITIIACIVVCCCKMCWKLFEGCQKIIIYLIATDRKCHWEMNNISKLLLFCQCWITG